MKVIATIFLSLFFATPVLGESFDDIMRGANGVIKRGNQVADEGQQTGKKYNYYVWTHLYKACQQGDRSACTERECRINELNLRLDMMRASASQRNPGFPRTGINCGSVQYRW